MPANLSAVASFIALRADFDAILSRPSALSADHFGASPDEVTWGRVTPLNDAVAAPLHVEAALAGEAR